jgi:putative ABC transport system permease protein
MTEIRHALRRLRATPVITLSAIACLSIGVWMTCIVSAVGFAFYRPRLNVYEPERLVQVDERELFRIEGNGGTTCCERITSKSVFDSLEKAHVFAAVGYYNPMGLWIAGERDRSRQATLLSAGMTQVLGIHVALGRAFVPSDDQLEPAAILSPDLWHSLYGGDSAIIGRRITLGYPRWTVTVVGIARDDFVFPRSAGKPDMYLSYGSLRARDYPARQILARLKPSATVRSTEREVRAIALRNVAADREDYERWSAGIRGQPDRLAKVPVDVHVARYYNEPIGAELVRFLALILGCGFAVVLIAAANVVNLLLVRGAARRQEIAVRMALGADRIRVIRQLLLETGLLACAGVALGYLVAYAQWQRLDPHFEGRHFFGDVDGSTMWVAIAAGIGLTIGAGMWPGIRATSMSLEQVLRDVRRSGIGSSPLEGVLGRMVIASTGTTIMLLICAVLMGLSATEGIASQGATKNIYVSELTLDDARPARERADAAQHALIMLRTLPSVHSAALGVAPPYGDTRKVRATRDGQPEQLIRNVEVYPVSDDYFQAMAIPLLYGRGFTPRETRDSTGAVVLGRTLAEQMFPGRSAVGGRVRLHIEEDSSTIDAIVVGIAQNVEAHTVVPRQLYVSYGTLHPARTSALVRYRNVASANPALMTSTLRRQAGVIASAVTTLDAQPGTERRARRYLTVGFSLFAAVGMVLVAVGTYGVISYSVARRTHEIGVRMALGARRERVTWMIVEQGLKMTLTGVLVGLCLSAIMTRILGAFIRDMDSGYPIAVGIVIALVCAISLVASVIPGYRAGRLNPVDALRAD